MPASVALLLLLTKVPAVEEVHPFDPSVPAVALPHEKLLASVPVVSSVIALPLAAAVTVVVLVDEVAVSPTAGKDVLQLLMAVARLDARVVVLVLFANVPVVELEQPFEPSAPFVIVPQEKLPKLSESVMVTLLPTAVDVTVTALPLRLSVAGKP